MNLIQTRPNQFLQLPLNQIDEDRIIFYDIETDHQYAAYAKLRSIAWQQGLMGKPEMVVGTKASREFKKKISSPDIIKVDFNGVNFDRIVLARYGLPLHPQNAHDLFFVFKTIAPNLPSFGLKFITFYYLGDPHFAEGEMLRWCAENEKGWSDVPFHILKPYNLHDVTQTKDIFRVGWDVVIRPENWKPYLNDLMMGEPLLEMETEGGLHLDRNACVWNLHRLQKTIQEQTLKALELTDGLVQNANSSPQLGKYFSEYDAIEMDLTASGEFRVDKRFLLSIRDRNPLADCAYRIREANAAQKYFEGFLNALEDTTYPETAKSNWIPVQFSVSSARTRRFTSQSLYKNNFQNPSEEADSVVTIRPGFLGWWVDATQVENIVHIYESKDWQRRKAYEADPEWNEYVWLCNMIYGTKRTKDEWDDKKKYPHPAVPHWSIYKGTKTVKLAVNFGMGVAKYCKFNGVDTEIGRALFKELHEGCPAIKSLQQRVARDLRGAGYVQDALGYRYSGPAEKAYKVMAYLIQGCGTGALPKAQIRANWESLRRFDRHMPERLRRQSIKCGVMAGTTHDENGGRIDLRLGDEQILQLLQKIMFNMTAKYSPLFDDIPLRAKLYLSKTTAGKAIECKITDHEKILTIINGEACEVCDGEGKVNDKVCKSCKGIGYIK